MAYERRRSVRIAGGWQARYTIDNQRHDGEYRCRVVNVSPGGAALELFGPVPAKGAPIQARDSRRVRLLRHPALRRPSHLHGTQYRHQHRHARAGRRMARTHPPTGSIAELAAATGLPASVLTNSHEVAATRTLLKAMSPFATKPRPRSQWRGRRANQGWIRLAVPRGTHR